MKVEGKVLQKFSITHFYNFELQHSHDMRVNNSQLTQTPMSDYRGTSLFTRTMIEVLHGHWWEIGTFISSQVASIMK